MTPNKKTTQRQGFKTSEFIVYPAHGVGQIIAIEEQEVAGAKLELFVISFIKDKMTLRVPTAKAASVGMRKLAEPPPVKRALETLKGRARVKRTMWSRRAQEYEAKINSGDLVAIAEVVRDLFRSESQPEQSYSERQLYEAALDRLSREISSVQKISETEAIGDRGGARQGPAPRSKPAEEGGPRRRGAGRGRGGLKPLPTNDYEKPGSDAGLFVWRGRAALSLPRAPSGSRCPSGGEALSDPGSGADFVAR